MRLLLSAIVLAAAAGVGGCEAARFQWDDDVLVDNKTKLAWQRHGRDLTSDKATDYCAGLSVRGLSEWRVPTMDDVDDVSYIEVDPESLDCSDVSDKLAADEIMVSGECCVEVGSSNPECGSVPLTNSTRICDGNTGECMPVDELEPCAPYEYTAEVLPEGLNCRIETVFSGHYEECAVASERLTDQVSSIKGWYHPGAEPLARARSLCSSNTDVPLRADEAAPVRCVTEDLPSDLAGGFGY